MIKLSSFKYAWRGILALFRNEANAQFHLLATILVIIAGFIFRISPVEWCIVIGCIGMVTAAEGFNTAIERLCDHICCERHPRIGLIKDLAAGAVLLTALAALAIALIIFLPKMLNIFL